MFAILTLSAVSLLLPAPQDAPEMKWSKSEATDIFAKAKQDFEAGQYKEAYDQFKKLKKMAKNKHAKKAVALWRLGSEGGFKLASFQKEAEAGKKFDAYKKAEKAFSTYRESPIAAKYETFLKGLSDELFTRIEDFESSGKRYSEKYGKTFNKDVKWVKQGKKSLRWETKDKGSTLKVKGSRVPDDLRKYRALSFWMCFDGRGAPFTVMFVAKGKSTKQDTGTSVRNGYFAERKAHKGWQRIEIPFDKFIQQGSAEWGSIEDFRIQFGKGTKVRLYVDDISLIKK